MFSETCNWRFFNIYFIEIMFNRNKDIKDLQKRKNGSGLFINYNML